jgi:cytochrome c-type biogenesis protein CcmH
MNTLRRLVIALALLLAGTAAALHPKDFQNPEEEARYRALAKELRCVMCQNQSLADSPAGVADDMRQQVLALIREGKTDAEVTARK